MAADRVTHLMTEAACKAHYADWKLFHQHEREAFRKSMRLAVESALRAEAGAVDVIEALELMYRQVALFDPTNFTLPIADAALAQARRTDRE